MLVPEKDLLIQPSPATEPPLLKMGLRIALQRIALARSLVTPLVFLYMYRRNIFNLKTRIEFDVSRPEVFVLRDVFRERGHSCGEHAYEFSSSAAQLIVKPRLEWPVTRSGMVSLDSNS